MWTQDQTIKNAVLDPTLPVCTRDGRRVEILRQTRTHITAFIEYETNPSRWQMRTFHNDGTYYFGIPCGDDLVNVPTKKVKKEGWVNIYSNVLEGQPEVKERPIARQSGIYKTKVDAHRAVIKANLNGVPFPVATAKIEWEEEQ